MSNSEGPGRCTLGTWHPWNVSFWLQSGGFSLSWQIGGSFDSGANVPYRLTLLALRRLTKLTCSRSLWLTLTLRDQSRVANSSKCFRKLCVNSEEPKWIDVLRWGWVPGLRNLPVEPSNLAKYRAFSPLRACLWEVAVRSFDFENTCCSLPWWAVVLWKVR